jgi:hypothetical protein
MPCALSHVMLFTHGSLCLLGDGLPSGPFMGFLAHNSLQMWKSATLPASAEYHVPVGVTVVSLVSVCVA